MIQHMRREAIRKEYEKEKNKANIVLKENAKKEFLA